MIAKLIGEDVAENMNRAEAAFARAIEINPDLSMAHNLYAQLEVDLGRAQDPPSGSSIVRGGGTATPSCMPAWSTPAAIAACSTPRWRRTSTRGGSTRRYGPAWRRPTFILATISGCTT